MTITTDLATSIGQIRLLIGDTVEEDGVKPGGATSPMPRSPTFMSAKDR